jgi:hypothetical protein
MLIDRDVKGAEEFVLPILSLFFQINPQSFLCTDLKLSSLRRYTKQVISELLQNKVDMSQLVITKALAKAGTSALRFASRRDHDA